MSVTVGRDPLPGERPITIGFVGFHATFNRIHNHIPLQLRDAFPIVVSECDRGETPDFLFFSVFGTSHRAPRYRRCVKIFTSEENVRPPWRECHYAMNVDRQVGPGFALRYLHLPVYARCLLHARDHSGTTPVKHPDAPLKPKTKFCNFVYSNSRARERVLFFEMLSKYKRVDSGGGVLNNLGYRVDDKIRFLEDYKFTIAFENSRHSGYISEKLVEPMIAGSIPIYWGDREASVDFNPRSFIDANEPDGKDLRRHFEEIVDLIAHLDRYDSDYATMAREPWFPNDVPNPYCQDEHIQASMKRVFSERTPR